VASLGEVPHLLISLPQRADRRASCCPQFERENLTPTIVDALTGPEARDHGLRALAGISDGNLGCFASHLRAWSMIYESGAPFGLVYEDDVILARAFRQQAEEVLERAPDWKLLQFGWFTNVRYPARVRAKIKVRTELDTRRRRYRPVPSLFRDGTHAYAIKSELAHELSEFLDSTISPIDVLLQVVSHTQACYAVEPSLAHQGASFSDIQGRLVDDR
jgi:glycosyl transferase, family 25